MQKYRNLLIQQANKRGRSFLIGPKKRVNATKLAKATGVSLATINRILRLDPDQRELSADGEWHPSGRTRTLIMDWLGYKNSPGDFEDALSDAPDAGPVPPTNQRGKQKQPPPPSGE